jgi:hypothetical protein
MAFITKYDKKNNIYKILVDRMPSNKIKKWLVLVAKEDSHYLRIFTDRHLDHELINLFSSFIFKKFCVYLIVNNLLNISICLTIWIYYF